MTKRFSQTNLTEAFSFKESTLYKPSRENLRMEFGLLGKIQALVCDVHHELCTSTRWRTIFLLFQFYTDTKTQYFSFTKAQVLLHRITAVLYNEYNT